LYACPIWGLNHIEDLEKFQTQFLRKLMSVTNLVPGFFLRLETQCPSIKVQIFKAVLRFIHKILCKPEDSKLYQCFIGQTKNKNEDIILENSW